jgi:aryl-alcohol dehydrogenase-like predicted oxidoreductase
MLTRPIPSSGEMLPVIGCGTYRVDVPAGSAKYRQLPDVLKVLFEAGGTVLDGSPMYGRAEEVIGKFLTDEQRKRAFLATKVWTRGRNAGIAQMERSLELLRTDRIDLMQVHNLVDWRSHLDTLAGWKRDGRVRYVGVTHYTSSAFAELAAVMETTAIDFVQLNYSLDDRAAETRLLPLAQERGIAVLVNRPFGGGSLIGGVSLIGSLARKTLPAPDFAPEIGCESWSQLLLTFVISHPAVTCAIPGTGNPAHMADAVKAGAGIHPEARERILKWWSTR